MALRILLVPSAYYPHVGGIEETTRQLALLLAARGHEAIVLTNRWPEGVQRSETLDGVRVFRRTFPLPASRPYHVIRFLAAAPLAVGDLLRFVRSWRPDIVHVIGAGPPGTYVGALRPWLGARIVYTAQGELTYDAHGVFKRSATLRAGLRRLVAQSDAVTACSAFVLDELRAVARSRMDAHVVPNGVTPEEFASDGQSGHLKGRYVLGVGRLVPQKGFDVLLRAIASDLLSDLKLVLAGDGIDRVSLENLAAALNVRERVDFTGSVGRSELKQLLAAAWVFAFPSRGEAFGIALLEAMAAGVPSVAAATGGIPEFARDSMNVLLVPPEDSDALATAIRRLADDKDIRRRLVAGGRRTATAFAWPNIVDRYEDVYRQALEAPRHEGRAC